MGDMGLLLDSETLSDVLEMTISKEIRRLYWKFIQMRELRLSRCLLIFKVPSTNFESKAILKQHTKTG
jgi:hypothetical protein